MTKRTHSPPQSNSTPGESLPVPLPRVTRTLAPAPDSPPSDWPTNLDLATVEGRIALSNAGNVADWIPRDGGEYQIAAVNWIVYPDSRIDQETGHVQEFSRVCLISADGKMVKFSSEYGPSALHRAVMLFTPDEWRRGIVFQCRARLSERSGRTYGEFRAVGIAGNQESK